MKDKLENEVFTYSDTEDESDMTVLEGHEGCLWRLVPLFGVVIFIAFVGLVVYALVNLV